MLKYSLLSQLNMQTISKPLIDQCIQKVLTYLTNPKQHHWFNQWSEFWAGIYVWLTNRRWGEFYMKSVWKLSLLFQFRLVAIVVQKLHILALNMQIYLHSFCSPFILLCQLPPLVQVFSSQRQVLTGLSTAAVIWGTLCVIAPRWECNDILTHALTYTCTQML